ncbi:MAG: lipoate--protein ligase, partial [Clostridia bacterium]|nr:lipoate--protein ligase [Clostridia bacterium]
MNKVYSSHSGDGHVNLAADQYILSRYRSGAYSGVTLYFYVNSNAVIIGRNQNAWRECNTERMGEDGVQLVRRHTGGGAVYHDSGNLNFSFITNEKLYDKQRFNSVIINA